MYMNFDFDRDRDRDIVIQYDNFRPEQGGPQPIMASKEQVLEHDHHIILS